MQAAKVLIVVTPPSREQLKNSLAGSALTAIGEATTLAEAYRSLCGADADYESSDILLVDLHGLHDDDEEEMFRAIRRERPAVKIIVLGDPASVALLWQAHATAIDGYLLHPMSSATLMYAVDLVMSGQQVMPPCSRAAIPAARSLSEAMTGACAMNGLSAREAEILQHLVGGSSNKAIARDLTISNETVKVHVRAILRKLKARNRTQAALWGAQNGFRQVGSLLLCLVAAAEASKALVEGGTSPLVYGIVNVMASFS
jgi:two-component system nitrate/nitrite response regulator NarL